MARQRFRSFVDLATLTLHRRHEMEGRISTFAGKCDEAINYIRKLKMQARTFVNQLNCEPAELKERFLFSMKRLDEYIYLMTEFNLSCDNFENNDSTELAPVQDNSYKNYPALIPTNHYPVLSPTNLMDMLSEPAPTASTACANMCPEKPLRRRPKAEQLLIAFSSSSCSAESVPGNTVEKKVQCVAQEIEDLTITDPKAIVNLPRQPMLDTERAYEATIMSVDGHTFWIVVDLNEVCNLLQEMIDCYSQKNLECASMEDLPNFTCCVYHDAAESNGYFRAMLLKTEGDTGPAQVFLVDTGEIRPVTAGVQPLLPRFRTAPPAAHCCHLADVEFLNTKTKEINEYLKEIVGTNYTMKIDDNSSESLGVYLFLDDECTLNELVLQEGLATAVDKPSRPEPPAHGPPEMRESSEDLDYSGPEHDNPVEAVTGYQNRDEMDICKHYKGGSERTCFKGANCKKRHVVIHPDGWTLDRVPTPKCRGLPLPPPGTWHRVTVTYVAHFDRLFVHFQQNVTAVELPSFGTVLPPSTLAALVRDMNSPATYAAFKPLLLAPAPGELVAAQYRDGLWYRARVNCSTHADQSVEVMYIDYGNVVSVKENEIMELEPRFTVLPIQAVRCRLAGVSARADCSKTWAEAKRQLAALAQDRTMEAHVISRDYDELTVEMMDERGCNLAHVLAATGTVTYSGDYEVDEAGGGCRLVQA